jgi:hypothetical protein
MEIARDPAICHRPFLSSVLAIPDEAARFRTGAWRRSGNMAGCGGGTAAGKDAEEISILPAVQPNDEALAYR